MSAMTAGRPAFQRRVRAGIISDMCECLWNILKFFRKQRVSVGVSVSCPVTFHRSCQHTEVAFLHAGVLRVRNPLNAGFT